VAYVALYRKFRPDTFEEVKGQDHIVTTLRNQVKADRVGHAYLFCGTRGTGKTSVAKLLAKAVNCENPREGSPCCECSQCKSIAAGSALNVIEIDAASNNGVDSIREIRERVQYPPTEGKKLVYIIDEVHMLSNQAFNALLKTLEEPPAYVVFILATTESHKVPITIKSRCQKYDFHRISVETISKRLQDLLQREGIPAAKDAVDYIARAGDGSMRDALSILDECVAFHMGEELTYDMVLTTIGAVDVEIFMQLLKAVLSDDTMGAMDAIEQVVWQGTDLTKFTDDFVWFIRNLLFIKMAPEIGSRLDMTTEKVQLLREISEDVSEETITRYLHVLQDLSVSIRTSTLKRVTLEMGIVRLMRPESDEDYSAVISRVEKLEKKTESLEEKTDELEKRPVVSVGSYPISGQGSGAKNPESEIPKDLSPLERSRMIKERLQAAYPPATYEELLELAKTWQKEVIPQLENPQKAFLRTMDVVPVEGAVDNISGKLQLILYSDQEDSAAYRYFEDQRHVNELTADVCRILGKTVEIVIVKMDRPGRPDSWSLAASLGKINFDIEYSE